MSHMAPSVFSTPEGAKTRMIANAWANVTLMESNAFTAQKVVHARKHAKMKGGVVMARVRIADLR